MDHILVIWQHATHVLCDPACLILKADWPIHNIQYMCLVLSVMALRHIRRWLCNEDMNSGQNRATQQRMDQLLYVSQSVVSRMWSRY